MKLLLAEEVADMLLMPEPRVYELVRQGKLPAVRIGRQVRFRQETLDAWLAILEDRGSPNTRGGPGWGVAGFRRGLLRPTNARLCHSEEGADRLVSGPFARRQQEEVAPTLLHKTGGRKAPDSGGRQVPEQRMVSFELRALL